MASGPDDDFSPYKAPTSPLVPDRPPAVGGEVRLLARWEKLRIVYNAILGTVTIATVLGFRREMATYLDSEVLMYLVLCGLGANVGFCAGPVFNAYAYWLGARHVAVTVTLFVIGTTLAALLTVAAVLEFRW